MSDESLIGKKAPLCQGKLQGGDGRDFELSDVVGKEPLILFFFPKAGSYGCNREACAMQKMSELSEFKQIGAKVIGISPDEPKENAKMMESQGLEFPILSDQKMEANDAFKVGRAMLGLTSGRVTFIINKEGIIVDRYDSLMNFKKHVEFAKKWIPKL
eukprot:TRINITY_DN6864_c0_g1_i1.p1 TRINITY_DN6864_c0_g1~~TRINITY_DN6864_c0_g1_i1.p1  ORF type:complete len:158 (+),score=55.10 TRINITY_DN6864_c0_g1_i1:53-526(+)